MFLTDNIKFKYFMKNCNIVEPFRLAYEQNGLVLEPQDIFPKCPDKCPEL